MELRALGPDIYACLQPDRGLGTSNSGLVARGDGLVVDTFWDLPHTRSLIDHYAGVWSAPPRVVVNTHHNGDHCWGNQLFPEAEIVAHRSCAESFARESPELIHAVQQLSSSEDPVLAEIASLLAGWDFVGIELRPPTRVIDAELSLDLDGLEVRLLPVGPAHTAGDVVVHIPERGVVFAGDVLFRHCTPIGWDGTNAGWLAALDRIAALEPEWIVPGHGPLCGPEALHDLGEYLRYVHGEATRHFLDGISAIDAVRRIDPGPYAEWTQPERMVFLVERSFRELRGEPADAPFDVLGLFRAMVELRRSGWARSARA